MKNKLVVGYSTNRDTAFQSKYNAHLIKTSGLNARKGEIEIVPFQNNGSYSLTEAYNAIWDQKFYGGDDAIFVFLHHDLEMKSTAWGRNVLNIFNNEEVDILGVAGTDTFHPHCMWWSDEEGTFALTNLWGRVWHRHGREVNISQFTNRAKKCAKVQPVVVVDGLFLAFNPDTCQSFDEEFGGFHFYDISWCLKNFFLGRKICVTENIQICHDSGGFLDAGWEASRKKMQEKYAVSFVNGPIKVGENV